jgi:N-hydroxyarylamine O-acetyltransferase
MEVESLNLDAYLARIGYTGARTPTLETLAAIHFRHPQAIPFENLDPLLKRPVSLDRGALERKMVRGGRGGWCFEQNLLLREVLEAIGFRVTGLAARAMWNVPEGVVRPRTHMLLKIEGVEGAEGMGRMAGTADAAYIADVGFGGLTLTAPLRLVADIAQATPHETFRLTKRAGDFILEALVRETWKPLYSFDLQPQLLVDYEMSNWYLSSHPGSPFVNNLLAARVTPDRRYNLLNNRLSTHHLRGESEQVQLCGPIEMRRVLEGTFGIRLPDDPGLDALLVNTRT